MITVTIPGRGPGRIPGGIPGTGVTRVSLTSRVHGLSSAGHHRETVVTGGMQGGKITDHPKRTRGSGFFWLVAGAQRGNTA